MKKKKKQKINDFNHNILLHKNDLALHLNNTENICTNSWFDMSKQYSTQQKNYCNIKHKHKNKEIIKCQKIKMIFNSNQKKILHKWFDAYTKMYNEGVKYIKTNYTVTKHFINREQLTNQFNLNQINEKKHFDNFYFIRSELIDNKKEIINDSQINSIQSNTKIQTHTLDYALRQLCSNIKSAQTNVLRNNFKKFRIKYWSNNRPSKTIEIEKSYIRNNKICPKIFGDIKYTYNNKDFNLQNIDSNIKINYNKIKDEYTLLIPIKTNNNDNLNTKLISLDPGLRTFLSGVSENEAINIGSNVNTNISKQIKRINKIKDNKLIPRKIKKKNELLINRKILNKVDELHWKTINFLTKNYKTIFLGNMSAKNIVNKKTSVISKIQKVACLRTKFYEFQQRLEYKCLANKIHFEYIDESYTSKTCSQCGYYKHNLGGNKLFICDECDLIINRDFNGARNIYVKHFCSKEDEL